MENIFISKEDRELYKKGAKNIKDSRGKVVKRLEISGQSYADKHGIDSLKMTVFSAKRAMQDILTVIDGMDEDTQTETETILNMLKPVIDRCIAHKETVVERQKVEKIYGDISDDQYDAIRAILNG